MTPPSPSTHALLAGFPVVVELDVAWGEMDSYAHVNNVVYFRYFESARIAYLDRIGWLQSMREHGLGPIVASTQARYRKPVAFPDHLWVGGRLIDLQPDRFTLEHWVVSKAWDAVATEGQVVVVSFDYRNGRKCPIPDMVMERIRELEGKRNGPETKVPGPLG